MKLLGSNKLMSVPIGCKVNLGHWQHLDKKKIWIFLGGLVRKIYCGTQCLQSFFHALKIVAIKSIDLNSKKVFNPIEFMAQLKSKIKSMPVVIWLPGRGGMGGRGYHYIQFVQ